MYPMQQLWVFNASAFTNLYYESPAIKYLYSFYFAITTSTTVGYGDISPLNPVQVIYVIGVFFISVIMFGYAVNVFWEIVDNFMIQFQERKKKSHCLDKYLQTKNISKNLQQKIRAFMEYQYDVDNPYQQQLINILNPSLRGHLLLQLRQGFFRHNLYHQIKTKQDDKLTMGQLVRQQNFMQGEVFGIGERIGWIQKGRTLQLQYGCKGQCIYQAHDHLSILPFFLHTQKYHYQVIQFSQIYFMDTLYPKTNKIIQLKHRLEARSINLMQLQLQCANCTQNHWYDECFKSFYIPRNIVRKCGQDEQLRRYCKRRRNRCRIVRQVDLQSVVNEKYCQTQVEYGIEMQVLQMYQDYFPFHNICNRII